MKNQIIEFIIDLLVVLSLFVMLFGGLVVAHAVEV
jgi:hypothetical protein